MLERERKKKKNEAAIHNDVKPGSHNPGSSGLEDKNKDCYNRDDDLQS
jgi:hypothetical protein